MSGQFELKEKENSASMRARDRQTPFVSTGRFVLEPSMTAATRLTERKRERRRKTVREGCERIEKESI